MLIVGQGGSVINLDVISVLGIDIPPMDSELSEESPSCYSLIADVQRNFPDIGSLPTDMESVFFYRCGLGNFESREKAQKVLDNLVDAYERGLKVFRVPKEEERFDVNSQC